MRCREDGGYGSRLSLRSAGMTASLRRLGLLLIVARAPTAPAQETRRTKAAEVIEHAGPALPARERAVERRHRARVVVLVVDPGAQHRGKQHCEPLRPDHAAWACRIDVGGGEHPGLRARREAVERKCER